MNKLQKKTSGFKMWTLVWGLGLAGQICRSDLLEYGKPVV